MIKKLSQIYHEFENLVSMTGTVAGLAIIFINVVMRYVMHAPVAWTDEISVIVLSWAIITGFSIDLGERSHICMDVIYAAVKNRKVKRGMDLFANLVGLLYSAFITVYGFQAVALQKRTARVYPITEFPRWIAYSVIVLVGVVMVIRYAVFIVNMFHSVKTNDEEGR